MTTIKRPEDDKDRTVWVLREDFDAVKAENKRLAALVLSLCETALHKDEPYTSEHNAKICAMGDTIQVNEGALWFLLMQARQALQSIADSSAAQGGDRE